MRRVINILFVLVSLLLYVACDDVLEDDITDDLVNPILPNDDANLEGNAVQFVWDAIAGAEEYRIQVIENESQRRVLDSLVSGDNFTYALNPGSYDWRVRGENFAYVTAFSFPLSFTLNSSNDLSNQIVFQTSPSDNLFTNTNSQIILTWDRLLAATSYTVVVEKTIQGNTSTEIQTSDLTDTSFTLTTTTLSEDAVYTWKVKASNDTSETAFSTRTIRLDTQDPNQPTQTAPTNDERVTTTVTFTWTLGSDTGEVQSPVTSILEIASDEGFSTILETIETDQASLEIDFTDTGDYFWRIRARDQANNESPVSEIRKFTVE
ncbi:hypothetical protein J8281_11575 [Aquimarina sp. U1-2]|uniref:hypothetical protein n=1 Tax=Aquimarina sp. U1-2 TaxID=2823141 RepID=UPI001AEC7E30|nr:hypothetical protein [Aquimarina sp. U1-2]MBP2832826.1 hypothetical protein [Aquimarina sp. U1-2]